MNTTTKPQAYSLNLSPRYAPKWAAWEVAREVICNAIDAAPDDLKIKALNDDQISVWTPTVPDLSELLVIGHGSKRPGTQTIGQFGEGLKMAALVATREDGSSMEFRTPGQVMSFGFEDVLGQSVLHAYIAEGPDRTGYEAIITMPGIAASFDGRILEDRAAGPKPKAKTGSMRVYCKGIFVFEEDSTNSIWDWNLNNLQINRDRSMVSKYDLLWAIRDWLAVHATPQIWDEILKQPDCVEGKQCMEWISTPKALDAAAEAFHRIYGEKAVLEGDNRSNLIAAEHGFMPVVLPAEVQKKLIGRVKNSAQALPRNSDLEAVDFEPYRARVAKLRLLDSIIGAPHFSVSVFANHEEAHKGRADVEDCRIWLNEAAFTPGNDQELVRTYLHEVGHLISSATDCSFEFEHALDAIAGRLAMVILNGEVG